MKKGSGEMAGGDLLIVEFHLPAGGKIFETEGEVAVECAEEFSVFAHAGTADGFFLFFHSAHLRMFQNVSDGITNEPN